MKNSSPPQQNISSSPTIEQREKFVLGACFLEKRKILSRAHNPRIKKVLENVRFFMQQVIFDYTHHQQNIYVLKGK